MRKASSNKPLRTTAVVLLFVVSLSALAAGYSFITDPSGKGLGITTDYLKPSAPFNDYFIPGLTLFAANGILSLVVAVLVIKKARYYPLLLAMQGSVYVGWIIVQLTMVTAFHPLHLIIGLVGLILIATGFGLQQKPCSF